MKWEPSIDRGLRRDEPVSRRMFRPEAGRQEIGKPGQ